jgi:hypothetical protein
MRLGQGAILRDEDVYDSTTGQWEKCLCPGLELRATPTIWVRPQAELSENARVLLGYLNSYSACVGVYHGTHYVIWSPTFNWDARVDFYSQQVCHPECVQELVDYGYLVPRAVHLLSDERVYVLTDDGKQVIAGN